MTVSPYKRIYICLTGRGAKAVKRLLLGYGISVSAYNDLSKEEVRECFAQKKILSDTPKTLKRLEVIINEEKSITNKVLRNYNVLLYVTDLTEIPNKPSMIHLKNQADYFIDYRERDGLCVNEERLRLGVDQLVQILLKNMR